RSGRQFVVIATGSGPDATLAAFSLPFGRPTTSAAPPPAAAPQTIDAPTAFASVCGPCHGRTGRGGSAPNLVPMTGDTNGVLAIVREGIGQMPPISTGEVSDEQVVQIVEYLRALARP